MADEPQQPVKRKRGRPRKIRPFDDISTGQQAGQVGQSLQQGAQQGSEGRGEGGFHSNCSPVSDGVGASAVPFYDGEGGRGGSIPGPEGGAEAGRSAILDQQVSAERGTGAGAGSAWGSDGLASSTEHDAGAERAGDPESIESDASQPTLSIDEQVRLLRNPAYYCSTLCRPAGFTYASWQLDFLRDCQVVTEDGILDLSRFPRNIALAAINGSGKTELLADVIRYFLDTIPNCLIGITSKVNRQLEQLEKYLKGQQGNFPGWHCVEGLLRAPNGNEAKWFCSKDAGGVESLHAPFLIRILDEVKSMEDEIIDATNRWHPSLSIYVSSKGLASGRFYECLTENRANWIVHEVDVTMCPWVSPAFIQQVIDESGENSALANSMFWNKFSDVDARNLITLEHVNRLLKFPPMHIPDTVVAGVDLSAAKKGGDECINQHRIGNKIMEPYAITGCVTEMEVVGATIRYLKSIKARYAFIDVGGMGGPMFSRMMEILQGDSSITLIPINFGSAATESTKYADRGTEIWCNMADKIERREIILPQDKKLMGQLVSREVRDTSDLRLKIEPKPEMRRKGRKSPDRADALALCLLNPPQPRRSLTQQEDFTPQPQGHDELYRHGYSTTADGGFDLGM